MFEIDKTAFGEFLAEQRKAKGYTQKDLAAKLYVSDKAVSKWERALSMPDISLLIPLSEILEVSVTELLEGRKLDYSSEMNADHVELLVKKAITFSDDTPEKKKEKQRQRASIFFSCTLFVFMIIWCLHIIGVDVFSTNLLVLEAPSFCMGIYFFFFMKDRLPVYYDENKINAYSDGIFRLNMPGIYFNNSNWPYIVKYLRIWSIITMITVPVIYFLLSMLTLDFYWSLAAQNVGLALYLAGLLVPLYVLGKKYG